VESSYNGYLYTLCGVNTKSPIRRLREDSLNFSRGLAALILIVFFQNILVADEYLYKDEVIHNQKFTNDINRLGSELYSKTGVSLRLVCVKKVAPFKNILEYEKNIIKEFKKPTILLAFSELDKKVDIYVNDTSLYKYFDREQVLSPAASPVQAFAIAITSSSSFDNFVAHLKDYGGTILPLIGLKTKKYEILGMYSAALYNGYSDISEQVARAKGTSLKNAAGNTNKNMIFFIKLLFYGVILYAIIQYIRRLKYKREHKDEFE